MVPLHKRPFGSGRDEEVDPGKARQEPPAPVPLARRDPADEYNIDRLRSISSEIETFIADVGRGHIDLWAAWDQIGSDRLSDRYGAPVSYLSTAYWSIFQDHLSGIEGRVHCIIQQLMECSELGLWAEWKTPDEDLEHGLRRVLAKYRARIDFSDHESDEDFRITVRRGDLSRTADVTGEVYTDDTMRMVNGLIADLGLVFFDMNPSGQPDVYFLIEIEHLKVVRERYGELAARVFGDPC